MDSRSSGCSTAGARDGPCGGSSAPRWCPPPNCGLSLRRDHGQRDDPELLHQGELVPERPGLNDLAVLELACDDTGNVRLLPCGRDAAERAAVHAPRAEVLDHVITLGDLALDGQRGVREGRRVGVHGFPRTLGTAAEVRLRRAVVDGVPREDPQVVLVDALVYKPAHT